MQRRSGKQREDVQVLRLEEDETGKKTESTKVHVETGNTIEYTKPRVETGNKIEYTRVRVETGNRIEYTEVSDETGNKRNTLRCAMKPE